MQELTNSIRHVRSDSELLLRPRLVRPARTRALAAVPVMAPDRCGTDWRFGCRAGGAASWPDRRASRIGVHIEPSALACKKRAVTRRPPGLQVVVAAGGQEARPWGQASRLAAAVSHRSRGCAASSLLAFPATSFIMRWSRSRRWAPQSRCSLTRSARRGRSGRPVTPSAVSCSIVVVVLSPGSRAAGRPRSVTITSAPWRACSSRWRACRQTRCGDPALLDVAGPPVLRGTSRGTGALIAQCILGIAGVRAGYRCRQGTRGGQPCLW